MHLAKRFVIDFITQTDAEDNVESQLGNVQSCSCAAAPITEESPMEGPQNLSPLESEFDEFVQEGIDGLMSDL